MSSTQSKTLHITAANVKTYITALDSFLQLARDSSSAFYIDSSTSWGRGKLNAAAMQELYPNSSAHPTRLDAWMTYKRASTIIFTMMVYARLTVDGSEIFSAQADSNNYTRSSCDNKTNAVILNSKRGSDIEFCLRRDNSRYACSMGEMSITLYFTRYDFSASKGAGISLAVPLSKSLVSGAVSGNTGGYSPYYGGQIAYTTLDGSKCVAITTTTDNSYPDGAIIEGVTLTPGKQYFYKVGYNAPVGKDIRIGMRLTNGRNTENIVVTGTGTWQIACHVFTATSDMSGQLEVVENGPDATPTTFYTQYVTIKDTDGQGYDGDQLGFYAEVQDGYVWDGWYSGDTKVSSNQNYLRTVDGSDVSLQARAVPATKRLTVNYGGSNVIDKQVTPPVAITYDGTQIASISSGQTKTLNCSNKLMSSNVIIGVGGTLLCSGKIMETNIVVVVS